MPSSMNHVFTKMPSIWEFWITFLTKDGPFWGLTPYVCHWWTCFLIPLEKIACFMAARNHIFAKKTSKHLIFYKKKCMMYWWSLTMVLEFSCQIWTLNVHLSSFICECRGSNLVFCKSGFQRELVFNSIYHAILAL